MDNLGSHKGKAVRQAIRAAGAHLIFLPPYSPDLNPIEQLFAKLSTTLLGRLPNVRFEDTRRRVCQLSTISRSRVRQLPRQLRIRPS